ncbi:MAG TPA: septation protein A [Rhizomicrobium sp.]|nr:septation protein A [Rhizomicrobium sp.]
MITKPNTPPSALLKIALDFGPLLIFFAAYEFVGLYSATAVFMVAMVVALALDYKRERKLAPMPLFTAVLVVVFGGLTLYLKNDTFIKMKPTVLYCFLGLLLLGGLTFNRLFIKNVFGQAFDLNEAGWRKLTWRWAFFALGLAILNEIIWRNFSTSAWVAFKVWAITPLIFLFALAQTPLVLKHENALDKKADPNG